MTKEETARLMAVIQAAYPSWHPEDMAAAINVWHMMLSEYDYLTVQQALKMYLSEDCGFAPTAGQLVDRIYTLMHPAQISAMEAWAKVSMAVSNSGYNADEEFRNLPPAVRKTVGSARQLHEWAVMESDEFETVVQSNFIRSYNAVAEREKQYEKFPADVKKRIAEINGILTLEDGRF